MSLRQGCSDPCDLGRLDIENDCVVVRYNVENDIKYAPTLKAVKGIKSTKKNYIIIS